jgi:DNA-binding transcriptional LysR family regulator
VFDWNDLRYFLSVARGGSSLAAARMLGTSQSTVHRRLLDLEMRIGCKLATRTPSGYRLTEAGQRLLPYAERAEDAISAFERQCSAVDTDLAGSVRVTCSSTLADRLATSHLIETFHTLYPRLRVEFVITDRYLDLAKGEADIAIRTGEPSDQNLVGRKIASVPWAVYATRSYVQRHGRPERPESLNDHFVIAFDGEIANYAAARWLRSVAPRAKIAARSDSWPAFIATVKTGVGIGPLPIHHGDHEKGLIHPDMRHTPRARVFFDYLVSEVGAFRALLLRQDEKSETGIPSST